MRRTMLLLWVLAAGVLVAPQAAAPVAPRKSAVEPVTVSGTVTDQAGAPIAGACVDAVYQYQRQILGKACTDAAGRYQFTNAYGASVRLRAFKAGYADQWWPRGIDSSAGTQIVAGGQTADFSLSNAFGRISGVVNRADGQVAARAALVLYADGATEPSATWSADAQGRFDWDEVPAGRYRLVVTGYNYPAQTSRMIDVVAGGETSIVETLPDVQPAPAPAPLVQATGHIQAPDGTPVEGATITILGWVSGRVLGSARTDGSGNYVIPGMSSMLAVRRVEAPGFATTYLPGTLLPGVTTSGGTRNAVLRPGSGTLRLAVRDQHGALLPFGTSVGIFDAQGTLMASPYLDFAGSLELTNLPAGQYRLLIQPSGRPHQWYPRSYEEDGAAWVSIADGAVTELSERLLPPASAQITVVDDLTGQPVSDACVTMVHEVCHGENGVYQFDFDFQAGTFPVTVVKQPGYFTAQEMVVVQPGQTTRQTIRVRPGAVITARFSSAVWATPDSALACLSAVSGTWRLTYQRLCEFLDETGAASFGPFEPGPVRIFADGSGNVGSQWYTDSGGTGDRSQARVFQLTAGQTTTIEEVRFDRRGSIDGVITAPGEGGGCADPGVPWLVTCTVAENGHYYRFDDLGPYVWPITYRSPYAAAVTLPIQFEPEGLRAIPVTLEGGSRLSITTPDSGAYASVFDARTGDLLSSSAPGRPAIVPQDRAFVVRLDHTDNGVVGCFYAKTLAPRWTMRYLTLRGEASIHLVQGQSCLFTEPALMSTATARQQVPRRWRQLDGVINTYVQPIGAPAGHVGRPEPQL